MDKPAGDGGALMQEYADTSFPASPCAAGAHTPAASARTKSWEQARQAISS